jgi:hypothetical protein
MAAMTRLLGQITGALQPPICMRRMRAFRGPGKIFGGSNGGL